MLYPSISSQRGPILSPERESLCVTVFILHSKITSPCLRGLLFNSKTGAQEL